MPEDTLFLMSDLRFLDNDVGSGPDAAGDFDAKNGEDPGAPPVHEIARGAGLYDMGDEKDAKSLKAETDLSLRFAEGDSFTLHLG